MNFWATIEHSLNYKYPHNLPQEIKDKLKRTSELSFLLDQEMSKIKGEIINAERMFEIKSSIISDILDNVTTLYSYGKISESAKIQDKFNKVLETTNIIELQALLDESNKKVQFYRIESLK